MEKIKRSIERLKKIYRELNTAGLLGAFEVYTYKHIPNNYFQLIDGDALHAKMMISHYIYGVSRANCFVTLLPEHLQSRFSCSVFISS